MLVNAEQQHTPSKTSAARGCGPTTFCASPVHDSSPDEAMSEFLENKAIISDPSDAERPPSVILESSGSEQYSDEKDRSQVHSRPHSLQRSVSDFHPKGSPRLHISPSPSPTSVVSESGVSSIVIRSGSSTKSPDANDRPSRLEVDTRRASRSNYASPAQTSTSAPATPSADPNRTYSFVFTSSRQTQVLGGERLIGVVNPSISKPSARIASVRPPVVSRHPTLSPEAIKAHALGAIHAISPNSPFQTLARDRAVSTVVSPIEIPIQPTLPLTSPGTDEENTRPGIDYYVKAARAGLGRSPTLENPSQPSLSATTSEEAATSRPAPHRRTISYTASLQSLGEHTGPASFKALSTSEQALSARPKRRRTKGYSKYVESDSQDYSFTTHATPRPRNQSHDSSASSTNSKASFDESITGLSCFGLIGSGTPVSVFGNAVISASRKPTPSSSTPTPGMASAPTPASAEPKVESTTVARAEPIAETTAATTVATTVAVIATGPRPGILQTSSSSNPDSSASSSTQIASSPPPPPT